MSSSSIDYSSYFVEDQLAECRELRPSMVRAAQESLGYRLPTAYIRLLRVCNGGPLKRCAFLFPSSGGDVKRTEYIHSIMGIGKKGGINGRFGSSYLIEEWDYPDLGVVISSEGHTAFMLDYTKCGCEGEPRVVYVDVELDEDDPYVDTVANDFATFLQMLYVPDSHDS